MCARCAPEHPGPAVRLLASQVAHDLTDVLLTACRRVLAVLGVVGIEVYVVQGEWGRDLMFSIAIAMIIIGVTLIPLALAWSTVVTLARRP